MSMSGNYGIPSGGDATPSAEVVRDVRGNVDYCKVGVMIDSVTRKRLQKMAKDPNRLRRGQVRGMNHKSRARFNASFFRHVNVFRALGMVSVFMSATYGGGDGGDYKAAKADLNVFLQCFRDRRLPAAGHWVAELQQDGSIHYHLAFGFRGTLAEAQAAVGCLGSLPRPHGFGKPTCKCGEVCMGRGLKQDWLRISGDGWNRHQERLRYGVDVQFFHKGAEVAIGQYMEKTRRLGREMSKARQKEAVAYGRTWGVINRRMLAEFRCVEVVPVDVSGYVRRSVVLSMVADQLAGLEWVTEAGGPAVRPIRLAHVGSAARFVADGDVSGLWEAVGLGSRKLRAEDPDKVRIVEGVLASVRPRRRLPVDRVA